MKPVKRNLGEQFKTNISQIQLHFRSKLQIYDCMPTVDKQAMYTLNMKVIFAVVKQLITGIYTLHGDLYQFLYARVQIHMIQMQAKVDRIIINITINKQGMLKT